MKPCAFTGCGRPVGTPQSRHCHAHQDRHTAATLPALWACAPSTPLRLLLERALRLTRPMLLDPEALAPCSSWLDPVLLRLQLDQLHQALTWEARGLPGWTALDLTLRELSRALEVEQGRGAS